MEIEFEGAKYLIDFQVPDIEDDALEKGMLHLDLYQESIKACGVQKLRSHFFDMLKAAVDTRPNQSWLVDVEPVRQGEAIKITEQDVEGVWQTMYDLGNGMVVTQPMTWLELRVKLKEPVRVQCGNNVFWIAYDHVLRFAVTRV
ncbi:MAG: hypothetical protein HDR18_02135 [Lachnospiraceae bacterium]|nr:hypothetical protein [Lachnospiraceae bacterium]